MFALFNTLDNIELTFKCSIAFKLFLTDYISSSSLWGGRYVYPEIILTKYLNLMLAMHTLQ